MARHTRTGGFTLVELMIALVITAFVLAGAIVAMRSQQRAYASGQFTREAQDSARRVALVLEERVRHAGLGMDPSLAFDFSIYGIMEPLRDGSLCPGTMSGCPRDSTIDSDELVFYVRDPAFRTPDDATGNPVGHAWKLTSVTSTTATVTTNPGDVFPMGQILQAVCRGDPNHYAYFTVGATSRNTSDAGSAPASMDLTLEAVNHADPFRRQDVAAGSVAYNSGGVSFPAIDPDPCFADAYAFRVDRYRFHVRPVAIGGGAYEPYLVLDMGVDRNLDGAVNSDDEIMVARGVEVFQVAYLLASGLSAGQTTGTAIQWASANPATTTFGTGAADTITRTVFPFKAPILDRSTYYASSWFPYSLTDGVRRVNAQGNIRAVRIGLVTRSQSPDPDRNANFVVGPAVSLFNFTGSTTTPAWLAAGRPTGGDRYTRTMTEFTIPLPNMNARGISL